MTTRQPRPAPPLGLSRVAVRLPRLSEPVDDILVRAGRGAMERKMFARVHGLRTSPTLAPGERMADLLVAAGRAALDGGPAALVLYGHTLLASELDRSGPALDVLRSRLGVEAGRFYGLSHVNCASVLRAVELARRYLGRPGAGPAERVLVLGGDQGSSYQGLSRVIPGVAVAGDAAVGVVVQAATADTAPRYRYLGGAAGRDTRFHRNLRMSPEEAAAFNEVCCEETVATMRRAVRAAGLTLDQVDWVMPHLSNRMFWGKVSRRSGIPKDRMCLDLIPERGHNFGTDAFMALEHAERSGLLRPGERCVLVAIGQGAYFQSMVVEVKEDA
jgi:3-oxoacyl-[acyl-carrier-protein] synthase-3